MGHFHSTSAYVIFKQNNFIFLYSLILKCSEYQIWVSSTADVKISFIKTTRNFAASCTFANSAQPRRFTVLWKMTDLDVLSVRYTLTYVRVYSCVTIFVKLLRMYDTSVQLYIYTCSTETRSRSFKITRRLDICWLSRTSTWKKTVILCILHSTSVKQRLSCCYTSVVFCL